MRRRIIVCLGLLLVLCLLGDTAAMIFLGSSISELKDLAESHRIQSMRIELVASSIRIERDVLAHVSGHSVDFEQYPDSIRRFQTSVGRCARCHHEPRIQSELDAINATFRGYQETSHRLFAEENDRLRGEYARKTMSLAHHLVSQTTELADMAGAHTVQRHTAAAAGIQNAWLVLSATLAAVLFAGGVVALHLERRLNVPLAALMEGVERLRQGDRKHRFEFDGDVEFRALGHALNDANTNLENAHESILQAEKMATVGRFAAGIAHEVGNPLASISSIAQVMRPKCTSEDQRKHIDLIMGEISRITRIVRELLTFSRGGAQDTKGRVDIGALLEHATRLIRYDKRARSINIAGIGNGDGNGALPFVRGNADRLSLVFTNIMINALDAMGQTDANDQSLEIAATHDGDAVTIRFTDNGAGMSEQEATKAFDPFFTTKDPGVGTGLGLWVCYQVIDAHGGTIDIKSQPEEGTTVTVSIPTEPKDNDQAES